jgi:hypothetical protein
MARRLPDYRDAFSKKKPVDSEPDHLRWWKLSGREQAGSINSVVQLLYGNQSTRLQSMLAHARLYGNISTLGPLASITSNKYALRPAGPTQSSYNIIQSVVDAVTSKIAKNKPRPWFVTSSGNFHQRRRAERLTDFVDGVFYENDLHDLAVKAFRDATVWGSGLLHASSHYGRVKFERVLPSEIFVDELEAWYGEPRQLHWVKAADRALVIEQFPDHAKDLKNIDPAKLDTVTPGMGASDLLQVTESWHLPSGPGAKDGKHVITCGELVLFSEEYDKGFFPFAKIDWSPRMYGFWGQGLAEQLSGIQLEVNRLSWIAQKSFQMAGGFKILTKVGSKIVKEHINNDVGTIIEYTGDVPPQYLTPQIISPEHLNRIETLRRSAFEQAGISQLSASSQKPAGIDSGAALRTLNDIESDRFSVIGNAYQKLFIDCARLAVAVARDIAEEDSSGLSVQTPGKNSLKSIEWEQAALDEAEYVTRCFPVSALPNEPAGRLQTVQELVKAGLLSPDRARGLLDFPDLEAEESLQNAQLDNIHRCLDSIVDEATYEGPEPTDNLKAARELALEYYARGKCQDLEPERLDMLLRYLSQIDAIEQEAQQPDPSQQAPAPSDGSAPRANPMPAPTSDLISNVPGQ